MPTLFTHLLFYRPVLYKFYNFFTILAIVQCHVTMFSVFLVKCHINLFVWRETHNVVWLLVIYIFGRRSRANRAVISLHHLPIHPLEDTRASDDDIAWLFGLNPRAELYYMWDDLYATLSTESPPRPVCAAAARVPIRSCRSSRCFSHVWETREYLLDVAQSSCCAASANTADCNDRGTAAYNHPSSPAGFYNGTDQTGKCCKITARTL